MTFTKMNRAKGKSGMKNEAPRCKQRGILAEFRRSQPAFALSSFGEVRPAIHPRGEPRGILAKANKLFNKFLVGVNYWTQRQGINMWKRFQPAEIDADFRNMAKAGFNTARIFLVWEDFQPIKEIRAIEKGEPRKLCFMHDESLTVENCPEMIDEKMVDKFKCLVGIAGKNNIKLIPTLLVGFMSGMLIDVPFRQGRNIYTDPTMLKYQIWYVRYFAERFKNESTILAWDLSNEQNNFMDCPSVDAAWLWTSSLTSAIRMHDGNHPVTSGMHGLGLYNSGSYKFLITDVAENTDFTCVHPYYGGSWMKLKDSPFSIRAGLIQAGQSQMYQGIGRKPCLCEEWGVLGELLSEDLKASYVRKVLFSILANGDMGALWWCYGDFECRNEAPYDFASPLEIGLGLFDVKKRPKPVVKEMSKFSEVLKKIDYLHLERIPAQTAIVAPCGNEQEQWNVIFNAFVLAKQAGMEVDIVRHDQIAYQQYKLLVFPSFGLGDEVPMRHWEQVKKFVAKGGTIYLSRKEGFCHGSVPDLKDVFGVKVEECEEAAKNDAQFKILNDEIISIPRFLRTDYRIATKTTTARIISSGERGESLITVNEYGKGKAIWCAEPIEDYLSNVINGPEKTRLFRIYEMLKEIARIKNAAEIGNAPAVERVLCKSGDDRYVYFIINHGKDLVKTEVSCRFRIKKVSNLAANGLAVLSDNKNANDITVEIPGSDAVVCMIETE